VNVYYRDDYVTLYHGDFRELQRPEDAVVVTDPPYNVGYHYSAYADSLAPMEYQTFLAAALVRPAVVIHYMESLFDLARTLGESPRKVVAWVYASNTPRQWRGIAWFGCEPYLSFGSQPYRNPKDKRIAERILNGKSARLYDWWEIDQVKNVSEEKTEHPCQIPLAVMQQILNVTPAESYYDPFAGSGTTLLAAKTLRKQVVGVEIDESYCEIIARRLSQEVLAL
jgi:DNA modification methylase